jgi:hypothetical protein
MHAQDECLIAGELQETSKRAILKACAGQDDIVEEERIAKKKKKSILDKIVDK